jgi:predicted RNA methylase
MSNFPAESSDRTKPATPDIAYSEAGELNLIDKNYSAGTLIKSLFHKARRKVFGPSAQILPSRRLGVLVFDRDDLDGGGSGFGQDYLRALKEIGIISCTRVFEFCSGPGYIGYSLLAHGFCRTLALADINPIAVQAARTTAAFNGLTDRVSIYHSDGLAQIPLSEKWDLVVSNPPHFPKWTGGGKLRCEDPDWQLHRKFYSGIRNFLSPGGSVFFQENALGSTVEDFAPMVRESGGTVVRTLPGPDIGAGGKMYYILSRWD